MTETYTQPNSAESAAEPQTSKTSSYTTYRLFSSTGELIFGANKLEDVTEFCTQLGDRPGSYEILKVLRNVTVGIVQPKTRVKFTSTSTRASKPRKPRAPKAPKAGKAA